MRVRTSGGGVIVEPDLRIHMMTLKVAFFSGH